MKSLLQHIFESDEELRDKIISAVTDMDSDELKWLANQLETNPETIESVVKTISDRTGMESDAGIIISKAAKRDTACLIELKSVLENGPYVTYDDLKKYQNSSLFKLFADKYGSDKENSIPQKFFEYIFTLNLMGKSAARGCGEILITIFSQPGTPGDGHGDILIDGHWIELKDCSKRTNTNKAANGAIIAGNANNLMGAFWKALFGSNFQEIKKLSATDLTIKFGQLCAEQTDGVIRQQLSNALAEWSDVAAFNQSGVKNSKLMEHWIDVSKSLAEVKRSGRAIPEQVSDWNRCLVLACLAIYKHLEGFESFMVIGAGTQYLLLDGDKLNVDSLFANKNLTAHSVPAAKDTKAKGPRIDVINLNVIQPEEFA